MAKKKQSEIDAGRRDILKTFGAGAVAASIEKGLFENSAALAATGASPTAVAGRSGGPYNILFILTDQERYFRPGELPRDYRLPGHERLAKRGMVPPEMWLEL
jgi:hypothetical protein